MLPSRLLDAAARFGASSCVITELGTRSWSGIADHATRFASVLRDRGVRRGDRVALMMSNRPEFLVAWFGISFCGAAVVFVNTALVGDGLHYILTQCEPAALVVEEEILNDKRAVIELAGVAQVLAIGPASAFSAFLSSVPALSPTPVLPHELCSVIYTSGTTGLPKGVMNSFNAYHQAGLRVARGLQLRATDRFMVFLPLFHINPQVYAVMSCLEVGASIALRPKFSASRFFEDAIRFGATGFTFVGTVLSILAAAESGKRRDHNLRFCIGGGAPPDVWNSVQERFGVCVHELYGMTETAAFASLNTVGDYRVQSCGRPRDDIEVRIFDEFDEDAAVGAKGEIVLRPRKPFTMLDGYFRNPGVTQEASRNFWFHTGDLGSLDADGYLYFHGRMKELIRRGGEMVSPVEIESKLLDLCGVTDAAAVGVPDPIQGEEIKLVVVTSKELSPEAVVRHLYGKIPEFMLPRLIEFVESIPRTETEKIQRQKLRDTRGRLFDLRQHFKEVIAR